LKKDEQLGRLNITTTLGDTDNDGDFDVRFIHLAPDHSVYGMGIPAPWFLIAKVNWIRNLLRQMFMTMRAVMIKGQNRKVLQME
jgi:hypothetical protein